MLPVVWMEVISASKIYGHTMQYYDSTNATGVWLLTHAKQFYYMITKQGVQVNYPSRTLGKCGPRK